MNIFEQAVKQKLRFNTERGLMTVEDLFDLPLTSRSLSLDSLAKDVNKQIKESEEESFVVTQSSANTELVLKLDILKQVIKEKLEAKEAEANAIAVKAKKERLLALISNKQDEKLAESSLEDLQAELAKLGE